MKIFDSAEGFLENTLAFFGRLVVTTGLVLALPFSLNRMSRELYASSSKLLKPHVLAFFAAFFCAWTLSAFWETIGPSFYATPTEGYRTDYAPVLDRLKGVSLQDAFFQAAPMLLMMFGVAYLFGLRFRKDPARRRAAHDLCVYALSASLLWLFIGLLCSSAAGGAAMVSKTGILPWLSQACIFAVIAAPFISMLLLHERLRSPGGLPMFAVFRYWLMTLVTSISVMLMMFAALLHPLVSAKAKGNAAVAEILILQPAMTDGPDAEMRVTLRNLSDETIAVDARSFTLSFFEKSSDSRPLRVVAVDTSAKEPEVLLDSGKIAVLTLKRPADGTKPWPEQKTIMVAAKALLPRRYDPWLGPEAPRGLYVPRLIESERVAPTTPAGPAD